jgi:hypothetical protein
VFILPLSIASLLLSIGVRFSYIPWFKWGPGIASVLAAVNIMSILAYIIYLCVNFYYVIKKNSNENPLQGRGYNKINELKNNSTSYIIGCNNV